MTEFRRIETVQIRLTPIEKKQLQDAAGKLSLSDYLRDLAGLTGSPARKLPAEPLEAKPEPFEAPAGGKTAEVPKIAKRRR